MLQKVGKQEKCFNCRGGSESFLCRQPRYLSLKARGLPPFSVPKLVANTFQEPSATGIIIKRRYKLCCY